MSNSVIKESTIVKRDIVAGDFETARFSAVLKVLRVTSHAVEVQFGRNEHPDSQYLAAADLREVATLFNEMADILDNSKAGS